MSSSDNRSAHRPRDTSAPDHARQIAAYRSMTGGDRVAITFRLNALARSAAESGIRARHPDYSEEQVFMALRRLWLGDELTLQAWPEQELVSP